MDKRDIRLQMKAAERLVRGDLREPVSLYWRTVEHLPAFVSANTILAYMSIPGEVPTADILSSWASSKRIAIPRVCGDILELREYSPISLESGYRGIMEPAPGSPIIDPEDIDLALVPGVAFSRMDGKIRRMGRGGGFYDRLLPSLRAYKLGVCFDFRVLESIPTDPWDAELDDIAVCRL